MKNLYIYLRFKFVEATFGRQTGHTLKSKSISNSASAKATSKYDKAVGKMFIKSLFRILIFDIHSYINLRDL